jgi:hypothetical protein
MTPCSLQDVGCRLRRQCALQEPLPLSMNERGVYVLIIPRRYIGWRAMAAQLIYDPCAPEWLIDSQSSLVTLERPVIPHLNLVVGVKGRSYT